MAGPDRIAVINTIFGLVKTGTFPTAIGGKTTWTTTEQRIRLWADVPPEQQPYMCLTIHREMDEYKHVGLARRRLECQIWGYARTDDPSVQGWTYIDSMMAAIENTLRPDNWSSNSLTLGGMVDFVRIEGRVMKDPGDTDNQALILVPLVVQMP